MQETLKIKKKLIPKKIIILCGCITMCFLMGACNMVKKTNDNNASSVIETIKENESNLSEQTSYQFKENPIRNKLFQKNMDECNKISYWLNGNEIEITDTITIKQTLNILSSVHLKKVNNNQELAGGIFIDLQYDDTKIKVVLFSDHILYDDVYYETDADIFETFSPFINNYLSEP